MHQTDLIKDPVQVRDLSLRNLQYRDGRNRNGLARRRNAHKRAGLCAVQRKSHGYFVVRRHDIFHDVFDVREGGIKQRSELLMPGQIHRWIPADGCCVCGGTQLFRRATVQPILKEQMA